MEKKMTIKSEGFDRVADFAENKKNKEFQRKINALADDLIKEIEDNLIVTGKGDPDEEDISSVITMVGTVIMDKVLKRSDMSQVTVHVKENKEERILYYGDTNGLIVEGSKLLGNFEGNA